MIRVEARREQRIRWAEETTIYSESFQLTSETAAGTVGVMGAFFDAALRLCSTNGALILDWGAGHLDHRFSAFASSSLNDIMTVTGTQIVTFVLTTREPDHMREAASIVRSTCAVLPNSVVIVVLNESRGRFEFASGSESAQLFEDLKKSAWPEDLLRMSRIKGEAIATLAPLGLPLIDLVKLPYTEVASRLRISEFVALACQANLAAFLREMDQKITHRLCFRSARNAAS
ncbi:MAG: hypothetical protein MUC58_07080 [Rhizobiaceae bacterium]|jgi:hypothetical protein|nr:hypothetical protein [Rhizobiaceae bacterium]